MSDLRASISSISITPSTATIIAASSAAVSAGCVLYLATRPPLVPKRAVDSIGKTEEAVSSLLVKLDRQREEIKAQLEQQSNKAQQTKAEEEDALEQSGVELIVQACQKWEKALSLAHEQRDALKVKRLKKSLRQAYLVLNTWNGGVNETIEEESPTAEEVALFNSNCARLEHRQRLNDEEMSSIHSFHSTTMEVTELEEAALNSLIDQQDGSVISKTSPSRSSFAIQAEAPVAPPPKPVISIPLLEEAQHKVRTGEVKYRIDRSNWTHSKDADDFMTRLHVVRQATERMVSDPEVGQKITNGVKNILVKLFKMNGSDTEGLVTAWDDIVKFTGEAFASEDSRAALIAELQDRRVVCLSLFDVAIDFIFFDALDDLERLPSGVTAIFSNSWLPMSARAKALSSAVWSMVKAKEQLVKVPGGFFARFYRLMEHVSPVLACGLLKCSSSAAFITATIGVKELILEFTQKLFHAFDDLTDLDEAGNRCKILCEEYLAKGEKVVSS